MSRAAFAAFAAILVASTCAVDLGPAWLADALGGSDPLAPEQRMAASTSDVLQWWNKRGTPSLGEDWTAPSGILIRGRGRAGAAGFESLSSISTSRPRPPNSVLLQLPLTSTLWFGRALADPDIGPVLCQLYGGLSGPVPSDLVGGLQAAVGTVERLPGVGRGLFALVTLLHAEAFVPGRPEFGPWLRSLPQPPAQGMLLWQTRATLNAVTAAGEAVATVALQGFAHEDAIWTLFEQSLLRWSPEAFGMVLATRANSSSLRKQLRWALGTVLARRWQLRVPVHAGAGNGQAAWAVSAHKGELRASAAGGAGGAQLPVLSAMRQGAADLPLTEAHLGPVLAPLMDAATATAGHCCHPSRCPEGRGGSEARRVGQGAAAGVVTASVGVAAPLHDETPLLAWEALALANGTRVAVPSRLRLGLRAGKAGLQAGQALRRWAVRVPDSACATQVEFGAGPRRGWEQEEVRDGWGGRSAEAKRGVEGGQCQCGDDDAGDGAGDPTGAGEQSTWWSVEQVGWGGAAVATRPGGPCAADIAATTGTPPGPAADVMAVDLVLSKRGQAFELPGGDLGWGAAQPKGLVGASFDCAILKTLLPPVRPDARPSDLIARAALAHSGMLGDAAAAEPTQAAAVNATTVLVRASEGVPSNAWVVARFLSARACLAGAEPTLSELGAGKPLCPEGERLATAKLLSDTQRQLALLRSAWGGAVEQGIFPPYDPQDVADATQAHGAMRAQVRLARQAERGEALLLRASSAARTAMLLILSARRALLSVVVELAHRLLALTPTF